MIIAKPAQTIPNTRAEKLLGVPSPIPGKNGLQSQHSQEILRIDKKYLSAKSASLNPSRSPELRRTPQANHIALVRLRDSSSLISPGSVLYLARSDYKQRLTSSVRENREANKSYLPSKWRKSVEKIETDGNNFD